ncbi:MAG TPA: hypothetical protein VFB95_14005 [Candidatus Cryosericum sp.]|nr:hypothetical protein [Candidatus Cryosericum sp.]
MSATDPLSRRGSLRGAMRAVEPLSESGPERARRAHEFIRCSYKPAGADFYCWKYGVWYNLMDCCYRHDYRTYEGCGDCGQGRSNLRQNLDRYQTSSLRPRTTRGR